MATKRTKIKNEVIPEINFREYAALKFLKQNPIVSPEEVWKGILEYDRVKIDFTAFKSEILQHLYNKILIQTPINKNREMLALELTPKGFRTLLHYQAQYEPEVIGNV